MAGLVDVRGFVSIIWQRLCSEGYFGFGTVMQMATVKHGHRVSDITHSFLMGLSLDLDLLSITIFVSY